MNYFKLLDLPQIFSIDKDLLARRFYELQSIYHPDLFLNDSQEKQHYFLKKSIQINKSYQTLRNDVKRAIYLLKINGLDMHHHDFLSIKNNFLIKHFSLYETLEELKKTNDQKKLFLFSYEIEKNIKKYKNKMHKELNNENWNNGMIAILKLLFFLKIRNKLKKKDINQNKLIKASVK